jgi:hypothetical protein
VSADADDGDEQRANEDDPDPAADEGGELTADPDLEAG